MGTNIFLAILLMLGAVGLGSNQTDPAFAVMELDVVSVGTNSFEVSWFTGDPTRPTDIGNRPTPVPADTVLRYGTSPNSATWKTITVAGKTADHFVEVTGLEPDTQYWFQATSNGIKATNTLPSMERRAVTWVRTPKLPTGEHLTRIALSSDLHFGEQRSGVLTGDFPPFLRVDPTHPYWREMGTALVADATARGADVLVADGDLTNEAEPAAVAEVAGVLSAFPGPELVVRGNHDRAHTGPLYEPCTAMPSSPEYHDCFADAFAPGRAGEHLNTAIDVGPLRLIGLDTNDLLTGAGLFTQAHADWLRAQIDAAGDRPVMVFMHQPSNWEAKRTWLDWPRFHLDDVSMSRLTGVLADAPNVLGVFSGHTHANRRSNGPSPDALYQEVSAVKEHIGGYATIDVYEGGLTYTFHKLACDYCRAWSTRSRQQYFNLYAFGVDGPLSARSYSTVFARPIDGATGTLGARTGPMQVTPATAW